MPGLMKVVPAGPQKAHNKDLRAGVMRAYSPPPSPVLGPNSTAFSRIGVVARQNNR